MNYWSEPQRQGPCVRWSVHVSPCESMVFYLLESTSDGFLCWVFRSTGQETAAAWRTLTNRCVSSPVEKHRKKPCGQSRESWARSTIRTTEQREQHRKNIQNVCPTTRSPTRLCDFILTVAVHRFHLTGTTAITCTSTRSTTIQTASN